MNANQNLRNRPTGSLVYTWKGRVYFGDTDAAAVVYHGKYVHWMEAARIDFLRDNGFPYSAIVAQKMALMPVNLQLEYRYPLRFEDDFDIQVTIDWVKRASVQVRSLFFCRSQITTVGTVVLACVDEVAWKPTAIPRELRSLFELFTH